MTVGLYACLDCGHVRDTVHGALYCGKHPRESAPLMTLVEYAPVARLAELEAEKREAEFVREKAIEAGERLRVRLAELEADLKAARQAYEDTDWREIFKRYTNIVTRAEGVDFLYQDDWTPEEWFEIVKANGEVQTEDYWKRTCSEGEQR